MRTRSACFALIVAASAAACSSADDHGLAAARERWAEHGPATYSFVSTRGCDCPPDVYRPIRVGVASGQIASAVYVDDQTAVAANFRSLLRTIDGVFDDIQSAIDRNAVQIMVDYDPALGYPTSVFVDYSRQIADEELSLQISALHAAN
jgi:hypothetical protein